MIEQLMRLADEYADAAQYVNTGDWQKSRAALQTALEQALAFQLLANDRLLYGTSITQDGVRIDPTTVYVDVDHKSPGNSR
jgi:hypothetical protein